MSKKKSGPKGMSKVAGEVLEAFTKQNLYVVCDREGAIASDDNPGRLEIANEKAVSSIEEGDEDFTIVCKLVPVAIAEADVVLRKVPKA